MGADYRPVDCIADLTGLVESGRRDRALVDGAAALVARLVASGGLLGTALARRAPGGAARNLVYQDPQDRFVLLALVWEPGYVSPIHDHGTWGVMAVYKGRLRVTCFRPGTGRMVEEGSTEERPGTWSYVLPPDEEIHRVGNPTDRPAISVHVYGREIRRCTVFDAETAAASTLELAYDHFA